MKLNSGQPQEWKLVSLRDCPTPLEFQMCDGPEQAANYWNTHVVANPYVDPDRETLVVLILNTRRRITGHHLASIGTLDTLLVSAREIFRVAIVAAASAIVVMHCHPSGDPTPSEADVRATRDLIRAGQLLKIEVCDHVIMGHGGKFASLKTMGYFSL
jgi:DNA repair protein RadC